MPSGQFEHKTLWGGPLDLTIGLDAIIPEARAEFIDKQLGLPTETALRGHDQREDVNESQAWVR